MRKEDLGMKEKMNMLREFRPLSLPLAHTHTHTLTLSLFRFFLTKVDGWCSRVGAVKVEISQRKNHLFATSLSLSLSLSLVLSHKCITHTCAFMRADTHTHSRTNAISLYLNSSHILALCSGAIVNSLFLHFFHLNLVPKNDETLDLVLTLDVSFWDLWRTI